jgi:hypothetical protein
MTPSLSARGAFLWSESQRPTVQRRVVKRTRSSNDYYRFRLAGNRFCACGRSLNTFVGKDAFDKSGNFVVLVWEQQRGYDGYARTQPSIGLSDLASD